MKTCEYCGSEVPADVLICPNCAAHFPDALAPMARDREEFELQMPAPPLFGFSPPTFDRLFNQIGRTMAAGCLLYILAMFLGLMSQEFVLLIALALLVLAVYIVRRAF